jgi:hypothetical protein
VNPGGPRVRGAGGGPRTSGPTVDCDQVRARTEDFVLGSLDGAEWADVVTHLTRCAACGADAAALAAVVDRLSAGAPAVEPSAGFVERVLDHLGVDRSSAAGLQARSAGNVDGPPDVGVRGLSAGPDPGATARPRRRRRVRLIGLAAAAVAALSGAGAIGWLVADPGHAPTTHALFVRAMRAPDGVPIGQAVASEGPSPWVTVSVDLPPAGAPDSYPDGVYTVVLDHRGGDRTPLGRLRVRGGLGAIGGPASQLDQVYAVSLEGPDGRDICAAFLP